MRTRCPREQPVSTDNMPLPELIAYWNSVAPVPELTEEEQVEVAFEVEAELAAIHNQVQAERAGRNG